MLTVRMSRTDHVFAFALFGSLFGYFLYGALSGDLYLPGKRGPGVHLHGLSAWLVTFAPLSLYAALITRAGLLRLPNAAMQGLFELALLFGGVALLLFGMRLGAT